MRPMICLPSTAIARNWNRWCSIWFEMQSSRSQEQVKLTHGSGSPHIGLTPPQRVEIGVSDNGPGVDHELADRLFEPLATSKEAGLGLGLPICASIVESRGGPLWLHSREAGATEFRFSLPLDQSQVT